MNFIKRNIKVIIAFIAGIVLASTAIVFATINANAVDYKNNQKVSDALDFLYSKIPNGTKVINEKGNQIDVENYKYADTTGISALGEEYNYGSGTLDANGAYSINLGFTEPREVWVFLNKSNEMTAMSCFKKADNSNGFLCDWFQSTDTNIHVDEVFGSMNGTWFLDSWGTSWAGASFYWAAIK